MKIYDRLYWIEARKYDGFDGIHFKTKWWRVNNFKKDYYFNFPYWMEWPPRMAHKNKHGVKAKYGKLA